MSIQEDSRELTRPGINATSREGQRAKSLLEVADCALNTVDSDTNFYPAAKWQHDSERPKPHYCPEAADHTSQVACDPKTQELREAELRRMAGLVFDVKGKPVGPVEVVRTEEILADEPTYTIMRFNDGTIRTDLVKK